MSSDRQPIVGIVAAVEHCKWTVWEQEAVVLAANYLSSVQAAGGVPMIIPVINASEAQINRQLDAVDAVIIAGGSDVEPSLYGAETDPNCETTDLPRDEFEIPLTLAALERGIPLLGICRGMQILNVALGGTLEQDLLHGERTGFHRPIVGNLTDSLHGVTPVDGTLVSQVMNQAQAEVASHHHQAVDRLGKGISIGAVSEHDQTCEAIELDGARFAVGVQWHAEATPGDTFIPALVAAA